MPFLNLVLLETTSVCLVDSAVPAVDVSRFITLLPDTVGKVTFEGSQLAPGTPGPPELERTFHPWAEMAGSVYDV